MELNIFNSLIITGTIQGFVFVLIVMLSKKFRSKSTLYLTALIFCYSFSNLIYILPDIKLISLDTMYSYLFIPFAPIIPVLIFLYVKHFLNPSYKTSIKDKLLFLPFILFTLVFIGFKLIVLFDINYENILYLFRISVHLNEIFAVIYSIMLLSISLLIVYNFEKQYKAYNTKLIKPRLLWLKAMLSSILFFTFFWAYLTYQNIFAKNIGEHDFYILWLAMAVLIYMFGHIGIYKFGILKERKKLREYTFENIEILEEPTSTNSNTIENNGNPNIIAFEDYIKHHKAYLDPKLTLDKTADQLQLSASYLSRIINSELHTNFPDYINYLRVEEAKSYLTNPEFKKYTILAIGLEAGFNSKSSFYNVFKKHTGMTPLGFKKAND